MLYAVNDEILCAVQIAGFDGHNAVAVQIAVAESVAVKLKCQTLLQTSMKRAFSERTGYGNHLDFLKEISRKMGVDEIHFEFGVSLYALKRCAECEKFVNTLVGISLALKCFSKQVDKCDRAAAAVCNERYGFIREV